MEHRYDPMTGELLQEEKPRFDPMTGELIQEETPRFDPMTGKPLQSEQEKTEPEMRFDPMTGEPIRNDGFDPMTGEPIRSKAQSKKLPVVGAVIGGVVVVAAVLVGCFVNGTTTSALNLQGWKSTYDVSGASVTLKGMALGSSNALSMALWRNADGSPKNVKVLYSLDGTNFTIVEDVALSTNSKDLKKFLVHTVELPSAVNGKTGVSVRLVPYGGNGALRLDDIVIREK